MKILVVLFFALFFALYITACAQVSPAPSITVDTPVPVVTPTWDPKSGTLHPYEGDAPNSRTIRAGDWINIESAYANAHGGQLHYRVHIDAIIDGRITVSGPVDTTAFAFNDSSVVYVSDPHMPGECLKDDCTGYLAHPIAIVRSLPDGRAIIVTLSSEGSFTVEGNSDE